MTTPAAPRPPAAGAAAAASLPDTVFPGASEMAARCRAFDWAATPLGPADTWPAALRVAAQMVLAAGLPTVVLWGPELVQLYNDGYAALIRAKHPLALGRGNREVWPEVWHLNGPIYARVFAGETVTLEDAYYPLERRDAGGGWALEDAYLTISFSPIRGDDGGANGAPVAGVLATMLETTREVERRRLAADLAAANARLADANAQLQAQQVTLEAQAEALQATAAHLEAQTAAAEAARAAAEAARAAAEAAGGRTRAVLAQAPVAIVVTEGPAHRFTLVNAQAEAFTRRRDLLGRTYVEAYPELAHSLVPLLDQVYATGGPVVTRESRVAFARPGSVHAAADTGYDELYLDLVFQPLRAPGAPEAPGAAASSAEGPVTGILHFAVDVTAQVRARQDVERLLGESEAATAEAEQANAAKSQFLATMSHELRTPLNAIGGYVQLLDMGLHGPVTEVQRQVFGRVQAAQTRLLGLINDVLNYAKLEGGRVEYRLEGVDLREIVAEVTPLVEPQLAAKGLALDVQMPETPCEVWADREKLGQVLLNLLSNAAKFTDGRHPATGAPGRVAVGVATREAGPDGGRADACFLRVSDTGRGIPRDRQDAIFEPFVQVRTGYAQATEGTGLGLAISRDLARGMGGDLRVRSAEGAGATFTVALRRAADAAGRATEGRARDARRAEGDRRRDEFGAPDGDDRAGPAPDAPA